MVLFEAFLNTLEEGTERRRSISEARRTGTPPKAKKPRKVSAYSKRYGKIYKALKKKHPRMSFGALSKKAHKEARRKK